jgi:hypothetical protein
VRPVDVQIQVAPGMSAFTIVNSHLLFAATKLRSILPRFEKILDRFGRATSYLEPPCTKPILEPRSTLDRLAIS